MRSAAEKTMWTLWLVLAGAIPAYANNLPAPDGMLSIILLFPVAILGFRLAGAQHTEKERKWRIPRGIALGVITLLTSSGREISIIALAVLLCYGLLRGIQAIVRGQGTKRFAAGAVMILFTFFAAANYVTSLNNYRSPAWYSSSGAYGIRTIASAEMAFRERKILDVNKNGVPEYGSLQQLVQAELISDQYLSTAEGRIYRYTLVLPGDPERDEKEFFVYASPAYYDSSWRTISLVDVFRKHGAQTTFAADENGTVRLADVGSARAVTREETQNWKKLGY